MGKYGGLIAGALAGIASKVGEGMVEAGVAQQKKETEMSLMDARAKLERMRDEQLAALTEKRDTRLHGQQVERDGAQRTFQRGEREAGQTFTAGENASNRTHQERLTDRRETSEERRHRERLEADRNRDSNRMKSDELRDTFTDKDGFVRRKASGELVKDPETGQPIKGNTFANGGEREILKAQLASAEKDVTRLAKEVENAYGAAAKARAKAELDRAVAARDALHEQLGGRPKAGGTSTSGTLPSRSVAGQKVTPDDYVSKILGG